ncbi:DUF5060 domain-containing protein [Cyclobacterium salsum]|uniref:DUF5060 domain-containing protein n=1 Tax=Cyclobacterium salsum TaxID=2666329 RepID=UPI001391A27B|nr:DUF5060 domain-containing protein [Cyclobacterium salsum]
MKIKPSQITSLLLFLFVNYTALNAQEQSQEPEKNYQSVTPYAFPLLSFTDPNQRKADGNGEVDVSGELKEWHKVTLTMDGPFAHELDKEPNPFTDYRMSVRFVHESGEPEYVVPGYFAADGNAAESGADNGIKWRAHLSPDKSGEWHYEVSFLKGELAAVSDQPWSKPLAPYDGAEGDFTISPTDKEGKDFRAKGRLEYVGEHFLRFKGNNEYFLKVGPDAPETLLAYADFDGTYNVHTQIWKTTVPIKHFRDHLGDWKEGDPTWQKDKGKGLIGAVNYLASKEMNTFSFLTYNAGGDGENVWPFIERNEKYRYDCSKLDQWQMVFDHAQTKGLNLHFKTQETEMDDNNYPATNKARESSVIIESLDGGDLGPQRRLYYRELIARFGYSLALNWNLGEENSQTTEQLKEITKFFYENDPYRHNVVVHTYPQQQDDVYTPLLGYNSHLSGVSLQNSWDAVHQRTLQWVRASNTAGKPWVVANDEQNPAGTGVPPDPDFGNYEPLDYDIHDIRKRTLWGNIMAGGAGVEYYFGNRHPDSDMQSENYRSRDQSWEYCRIAHAFFMEHEIPFWKMTNRNALIFNEDDGNEKYCLALDGEQYLVYLADAQTSKLDLRDIEGSFVVKWFNPREGGTLMDGNITEIEGGDVIELGLPPEELEEDWLVYIMVE